MIYNTTRTNRDIDRDVDALVGKRFGLMYILKNGSIGSEPFIIASCSAEIGIDFDRNTYERKCNIELRPNGIIIHFRKKSSSFIWPIPFRQLSIYQSGNRVVVFQNTLLMRLYPKVKSKQNSPFIQKIISAKADQLADNQMS